MKDNKKTTSIIDSPRKLMIPDNSGNGNHIVMVVNWNPFIKNCEYIKLIMPNGDDCIVQKDEFRSLMMMIAKEEEITDMGQTRVETVRALQIPVTITASRNYKRGEKIYALANYKFRVPQEIVKHKEEFKGR